MKSIIHNRFKYYPETTIGEIFIDSKHFCFTLEDTVRASGIKVQGYTAIPSNHYYGYKVGIRYSPGFKRDMLILYTEDDKETLEFNGISFKYVYSHGGNKHEDTEGCVLVAKSVDGNLIYGTMEKELFDIVSEWIKAGEEVRWFITNGKQEK